jgi:hypothetical protein
MGDENRWSRNDKIAFCSLLVAAVGCIAALIVVPEFRHSLGLDSPSSSAVNRSSANPRSSPTPLTSNPQTENGEQPTTTPLPMADSGLVTRLARGAPPDQNYLDFGRILRVGLPEHFSGTNPHQVAQCATFLYKEGDEDGLLKTFNYLRKDPHFSLDMMYPSIQGKNQLLALRGEIVYLKFVGFEEKENYTRRYYFLVSSSGHNFDLDPWIEIVRSKDSGNCILRNFQSDGFHNPPVTGKR